MNIYEKLNIDITRLKRNYLKCPIIKKKSKEPDYPELEDFLYFFLELYLKFNDLMECLNVTPKNKDSLTSITKYYGIPRRSKKLQKDYIENKEKYIKLYSREKQKYNPYTRDWKNNPLKRYEHFPKGFLEDLYIKQNMNLSEILKFLNCKLTKFQLELKRNNIHKDPSIYQEKIQRTLLKKYGVNNAYKISQVRDKISQVREKYNYEINKKIKETKLKNYGNENYNNMMKIRKTCMERYGVPSFTQTENFHKMKESRLEKYKNTCMERYGKEYYTQTEKYQERLNYRYNTMVKNHTNSSLKLKELFYQELLKIYPNTIHHPKRTKEFPFICDFYIPELELYIEYNGGQCHGPKKYHEPFDINKPGHLEIYNNLSKKSLKFKEWMNYWRYKDPKKRLLAKLQGKKLKEIWNIQEMKVFLQEIKKED